MNKAVLVYTISDDSLRKNFVETLISRGWVAHKDQSTLTLPQTKSPLIFSVLNFKKWFEVWREGKNWNKGDFLEIFYPVDISVRRINIPSIRSIRFSIK